MSEGNWTSDERFERLERVQALVAFNIKILKELHRAHAELIALRSGKFESCMCEYCKILVDNASGLG